ncbi:hypothetical protein KDU71_05215 [Carboxylicivirga sediminis]|uniref:Uncharacterized protein n=1 Tax=Carboxylicivirga sediminis TaxID=2006564 RepID=A0A941F243_9BACT|nr:hypothetical protein [Carboxylicivirga sediminis]MBR8534952.1 hypothetical protein [Carboxylicivirga sediminis]
MVEFFRVYHTSSISIQLIIVGILLIIFTSFSFRFKNITNKACYANIELKEIIEQKKEKLYKFTTVNGNTFYYSQTFWRIELPAIDSLLGEQVRISYYDGNKIISMVTLEGGKKISPNTKVTDYYFTFIFVILLNTVLLILFIWLLRRLFKSLSIDRK